MKTNLLTAGPYGGNIASSGEQRWRESWAISCGRSREQSGSVQAPRLPRRINACRAPYAPSNAGKNATDRKTCVMSVSPGCLRCSRVNGAKEQTFQLVAVLCPSGPIGWSRLRRLLRTSIWRGTVHTHIQGHDAENRKTGPRLRGVPQRGRQHTTEKNTPVCFFKSRG